MKKILLIFLVLVISLICYSEEIYRIRIENSPGGLVQVSLDGGKNYYATGSVVHPADKCGVGFMASGYIEGGCVCAAASHAIRIKISPKDIYNLDFKSVPIFSVLPKEFWSVPKGFGGHVAGNSGIYTDIHTASGIFLNFAPFPNTAVFQEYKGELYPIGEGHIPSVGNVYVIPVLRPETEKGYICFENFSGGDVTLLNGDILTKVHTPVSAIGRYDATTYNSPGQLNTVHGGVITIATSKLFPYSQKEGDKPETRGGFMIQPLYHAIRQGEKKPQVMTIGRSETSFEQEGQAPLYSQNINLWYFPKHLENSYYAELKVDDRYIPMPTITGREDRGLTKEFLNNKLNMNCERGVTGVRIHIPEFDRNIWEEYLKNISGEYNKKFADKYRNASYVYVPKPNIPSAYGFGVYYVDGKPKGMTSDFGDIKIDTKNYIPGLHSFSLVAENSYGEEIVFSDCFLVK
ncbi:MAG: hypothetical protein KBT47_04460 [Armatimonadetes bacterium]|nr:hypothetical protein [Candidatus Hippobium faecium]